MFYEGVIMKQNAKRKIIHYIIALLELHPFENITIKMLCAYSDINRTTFYDYFVDKYDLLATIQSHHIQKYKKLLENLYKSSEEIADNYSKLYQFFKIILRYIKRHYGYFHAILVTYPNRDLFFEYMHATRDTYIKILDDYTSVINKKQFVIYALGGQMGLVYTWIKEGCNQPVNDLAQILLANTIKLNR